MPEPQLPADPSKAPRPDEWFFRTALHRALHPPPLPRRWALLSLAIVIAAVVLCLLLAWHGARFHDGRAWHHFREKHIGTHANVALLFACSGVCLHLYLRFRGDSFARFWLIHFGAFAFLGLDDLFRLHEGFDFFIHKLTGLDPKNEITTHIDDLIVLLYAAVLIAVWWLYRWQVLDCMWMIYAMALAAAGFALMMLVEILHAASTIEESIKLVTTSVILCALLAAVPRRREQPPKYALTAPGW